MIDFTEAFTWLNEFEASELTLPASLIRDQIVGSIQDQLFLHAYQVIEYLKAYGGSRVQTAERAEIWVECSAAFYDMGNPFEAMSSLKQALENYAPTSHRLPVTRWLLGIAQWCVDAERMQAVLSWQNAIEEFQNLKKQADYDNDCDRKDEYELLILRLTDDLKCQIEHFQNPGVERRLRRGHPQGLPPRPAGGEPAGSAGPYIAPPPATDAGNNESEPYTYEVLVMQVRGDRSVADRLIEGEHRRFPTESRQQNITRAILRWRRDNQ